ncbi:antitoxin VbhA family protein [Paraburkholderia sp.]|uniref:antitoxin VbhA family protein n=1 Tax=Paraburkholderia sp. TaxID=1926495 RepID=UPI0025EA8500|nr:antitoxin VbhA family protein [Paraburkholderia sp.]
MTKPSISDEERQRRLEAVRYACASVGLEGFWLSSEARAQMQRFIDGEISLADLVEQPAPPAPIRLDTNLEPVFI